MGIKFEFDGDDFQRRIMKQMSGAFDQRVGAFRKKVEAMTCPTHGGHPQVTVTKGADFASQLSAGEFCCEEFRETVSAYLTSATDGKAA